MYFHFPGGKVELASAAVDHFADRSRARMERYLAETASVRDAVVAIFDAYVDHLEHTAFAEGCAVATVALDGATVSDVLAGATTRAFTGWTGVLAEALAAEGHAEDDAHALATLVIAAIEGTVTMAKGLRSTEPVATTRDVLAGLLAPPVPAT
jgi:TetR/AcrR family transcriptional repressor of lmrAB and yxaGH operons